MGDQYVKQLGDRCVKRLGDRRGRELDPCPIEPKKKQGGLYATSAAQCCKKCSKVKGCKYWTYGTNRHRCWVKSAMAGYTCLCTCLRTYLHACL